MVSAKPVPDGARSGSVGVGEIQMSLRGRVDGDPPNPNKALDQFLVERRSTGEHGLRRGQLVRRGQGERLLGRGLVGSRLLDRRVWSVVSWADVSWADVSWADVSWADVSWATSPGRTASYEDAAEGDASGDPSGYELTPEQAAEIMADPEIAPARATRSRRRSRRAVDDARQLTDGRARFRSLADRESGIDRQRGPGAIPAPPSFGGYSRRTEKGGCDPARGA